MGHDKREGGVFGVHRGIWEHPVLADEDDVPFTKIQAWLWLVSVAAWREVRFGSGGTVIALERGEFCHAVRFLDRKWNWKPGRAERFLKTLKKHDMIRDTSRDGAKIYLISNYNEYQVVSMPKRDTGYDVDRDTTATRPRHDRDTTATKNKTLEEGEEGKKGKEKVSRAPRSDETQEAFDDFWAVYPKKAGKGAARKAFLKALSRASPEQILAGARAYAAERQGQDPAYTKFPQGWLNEDRWLDERAQRGRVEAPKRTSARSVGISQFLSADGGGQEGESDIDAGTSGSNRAPRLIELNPRRTDDNAGRAGGNSGAAGDHLSGPGDGSGGRGGQVRNLLPNAQASDAPQDRNGGGTLCAQHDPGFRLLPEARAFAGFRER